MPDKKVVIKARNVGREIQGVRKLLLDLEFYSLSEIFNFEQFLAVLQVQFDSQSTEAKKTINVRNEDVSPEVIEKINAKLLELNCEVQEQQ